MGQVNYLEILEQAWQQHLAPREPDAPTLVSTFAGCGGSSLGYSMAGFRELLAVEWNSNAVETFKLNFPGVPVYHGDIHKLSVDECLRLTGLQPGELDLLDGSPPCQGFSTAGKRKMKDKRNQLYMQFVRLLRGLQPKVFVMENVSGLVKGKMKLVFAEIMRELKASGYQVRCKLLNAMYFNVPQSRQRLIFAGVRDDLGVGASFPGAQSKPVTLQEALANSALKALPPLDLSVPFSYVKPGSSVAKDCPVEILKVYFPRFIENNTFNFGAYAKRQRITSPSQTIEKTYKDVCPIHPIKNRHYSIGELQRIASYPDDFDFCGRFSEQWARIGNSVPPLMMRAIANHIKTEILANDQ